MPGLSLGALKLVESVPLKLDVAVLTVTPLKEMVTVLSSAKLLPVTVTDVPGFAPVGLSDIEAPMMVNWAFAVLVPSVAETVYMPGLSLGALKLVENEPPPDEVVVLTVTPLKVMVIALSLAKLLPVTVMEVPAVPLVGFNDMDAVAAMIGVANIERTISAAARSGITDAYLAWPENLP
jgi:hypothetical protein